MHDRIRGLLDLRFRHVIHANVADAMKYYGFHEQAFLSVWSPVKWEPPSITAKKAIAMPQCDEGNKQRNLSRRCSLGIRLALRK
jgi:hypothetical protein